PRGTSWEMNGKLGPITCFRSTVISCNAPKGTSHVLTWNSKGFDCEGVRGEYEKPKSERVVIPISKIKVGVKPGPAKKRELNTQAMRSRSVWIKCKCGLSQK